MFFVCMHKNPRRQAMGGKQADTGTVSIGKINGVSLEGSSFWNSKSSPCSIKLCALLHDK